MLSNPHLARSRLDAVLARLVITLEVYALQPHQPSSVGDGGVADNVPTKEVIYSGVVDETEKPFLTLEGRVHNGGGVGESTFYVVWKMRTILSKCDPFGLCLAFQPDG